jgi:hypothetical protein
MRFLSSAVGLGVVVFLSGCADSKWSFLRNSQDLAHRPGETPTSAQLVAYWNQNAQRLQTLECKDLDLDIKTGIQQFGARGKLAAQKPKSFRMVVDAMGNRQADFGSNDQEFWYWIAKSEPPYLVHCSYDDLKQGVRIPFPFQPEWVMEALGMAEFDSTQRYNVEPGRNNTLQLVQDAVNSQGQPVRKVTVFNSSTGQVRDHILKDARGKELCSAHIIEMQNINGALLPRRIVLVYSADRDHVELKMKLDDVVVNRPFEREEANWLFSRPAFNGVQSYDLRRGLDAAPGQVQPAGGLLTR